MALRKEHDKLVTGAGHIIRNSPRYAANAVRRTDAFVNNRKKFLTRGIQEGMKSFANSIAKTAENMEKDDNVMIAIPRAVVGVGVAVGKAAAVTTFETLDRLTSGMSSKDRIAYQKQTIRESNAKVRDARLRSLGLRRG